MHKINSSAIAQTVAAASFLALAAAPSQAQSTAASADQQQAGLRQLDTVNVIGTVNRLQRLDFYAPNSSAVIGQQDIQAQGARKLDWALHYQSGILSEPYGSDNKLDWFKIRGFDASTALDGTPTTPNGFFVWKPEVFGLEAIEVLKGPSALVIGSSQTGGVVNLISKRPQKKRGGWLQADLGSPNSAGFGVDYNDLLDDDGAAYYRIVAQARRANSLQQGTYMQSYYLAPSLTFELSRDTALTLLASLQREVGRPSNGFLPGYGSIIQTPYGFIDRRLNAGEPDFDQLKRTQFGAGWFFRHDINQDWAFNQNYRFSNLDLDQHNVFAYGADQPRQLKRGYTLTKGRSRSYFLDNHIAGVLRLGPDVKLLPTIGIDYLKSDTAGHNNGFGSAPNLDMFAPVYGVPFATTATPYQSHSKQLGLYAAAQLQVGQHWNFNAGLRRDHARGESVINQAATAYNLYHDSINLGAMYISDYGLAPYLGYFESFNPIAGVDGYGRAYQPYEGRQLEAGLKFEPARLAGSSVTLAHFRLVEKNALVSDASNVQSQSGRRSNQGWEIQGNFKLSPQSSAKISYTYNHAQQDIGAGQSVRAALIPKQQVSFWLEHRLPLSGGDLTLAGGVRYNGTTVDQRYHPNQTIAAYALFDLMASYQFNRRWKLQFNARNLADKTYVSSCDYYCYYGSGRSIDAQIQYLWR